ncbi:MAG TPA: glycosyltransferase [Thermoleophilaceae bacterium]
MEAREVGPLSFVDVAPLALDRFERVLTPEQEQELLRMVARGRVLLEGRVVWSVNSTAHGGGVAEMLQSLIAYARGGGVDARWAVIGGEPDFFRVTKRIHNRLHGYAGDGGPLGEHERAIYDESMAVNAERLASHVQAGDIVLLHDPQTAGLVDAMKTAGAHVVWRAHVGLDSPNDQARDAWRFLLPYVSGADGYVFSRRGFAWEGLDQSRLTIIPPSIDPFSPKNQDLDPDTVRSILHVIGLQRRNGGAPVVTCHDGSSRVVERHAELVEEEPLPEGAPIVTQVSRWDRLKDPIGVMEGFVAHVVPVTDAHLVLAGPETRAVADDPEGAEVLRLCVDRWHGLAPEVRRRVHLAMLPMADGDENAAMVNALQRSAAVVVQKSIAEGFGLTVSEAMWKARPVVASRVGGIQDQIVDGQSGRLVEPTDLESFGAAVAELLLDHEVADHMGKAAMERVRMDFLGARHLGQWVDLFDRVIAATEAVS